MTTFSHTDPEFRETLDRTKVIAIVGVTTNPVRPSFYVARYLQLKGYRIVPVNPRLAGQCVLGQPILPSLDAASGEDVDMVDIFRRSSEAGAIVDQAISVLPNLKTIWMQIGVSDPEAAARAKAVGLTVVMNRCPKIEYQRLYGELRIGGFNTGIVSSRIR
ncbi:MAG: CoA-binding protein [Pseudomonadota bacterium]